MVIYRSTPMIDLHCHVLPGIDDGPKTIDDSLMLARSATAAGIHTLVATPHVSRSYPNDADTIVRLVEEVNARLVAEGVAIEIRPGAEIAMARLIDVEPAELRRLGLGGGPWVLVEPPFATMVTGLDVLLAHLQDRGYRVVLAHPERSNALRREPAILESLVEAGMLTSITAGSLVGRFGDDVRRFAISLAKDGMIHNVSSDAHDHVRRPFGIAKELEQVGLGPLTDWLTRKVPTAILNDEKIPPRPMVALPDLQTTRGSIPRRRGLLRRAL
jgi:protein-tyrosine phosphatase